MSEAIRWGRGSLLSWRRAVPLRPEALVVLVLGFWIAWAVEAAGQGSVAFVNRDGNGIDAPVVDIDGLTRVEGSAFLAQLYCSSRGYMGPPPAPGFVKAGTPRPFGVGAQAGYFGIDGNPRVTLPALDSSMVRVEVRVWEAARGGSFEEAVAARGRVGVSDELLLMSGWSSSRGHPLTGLRPIRLWPDGEIRSVAITNWSFAPYWVGMSADLRFAYRGLQEPIQVTWYRDHLPIPGGTSAVLRLSPVRRTDRGDYFVRLTSPSGEVTSANVQVKVFDPPVVQNVEVTPSRPVANEPLRLVVSATCPDPFTYTWWVGGKEIPGATGPVLELPAASPGTYSVILRTAFGSITRGVATVVQPIYRIDLVSGIEGGSVSITPDPNAGFTNGAVATLSARPAEGYEFAGWTGDASGRENPLVLTVTRDLRIQPHFRGRSGTVWLATWIPNALNRPVGDEFARPLGAGWGGRFYYGATPDELRPIGTVLQFTDGHVTPAEIAVLDGIEPGAKACVQLRYWKSSAGGSWEELAGIPNVRGSSAVLSVTTGSVGFPPTRAPYLQGLTGFHVDTVPMVASDPKDLASLQGLPARFEARITGQEPIRYQWLKDGVAIPGANEDSLVLPSPGFADEGKYSLRASNSFGFVETSSAVFSILRPPRILDLVFEQNASPRRPLKVRAVLEGSEPLTIVWTRNGVAMPEGAGLARLELADALPGAYRLEVANEAGVARREVLDVPLLFRLGLVVEGDGAIEPEPSGDVFPPGAEVRLKAVPAFASLFERWAGDGIGTNAAIQITMDQDRQVVAVFSAVGGTVLFANRIGSSLDAPVFEADGVTRVSGQDYQAQLYGGTEPALMIPLGVPQPFRTGPGAGYVAGSAVRVPKVVPGATAWIQMRAWERAAGDTFEEAYRREGRCGASELIQVQTGGAGSPPSLPTPLIGLTSFHVEVASKLSVSQSVSVPQLQVGDVLRLEANSSGLGPIWYQWLRNGIEIPGATNAVLEVPSATVQHAGEYRVRVSNRFSSVDSPPSEISIQRRSQHIVFTIPERLEFGSDPIPLVASASSGLPVEFELASGPARIVDGRLEVRGAGWVRLSASQRGDETFSPAVPEEREIHVAKARAEVILGQLDQVADGSSKPAKAVTVPADLKVELTYDGSPTPPSLPGVYRVDARIDDANYDGLAVGTLQVRLPTFEWIGRIFEDSDSDGRQGVGESGLEGFTVRIMNSTLERTVTTDSNGEFRIGNLPSGTYAVTVIPQPGYVATGSPEDPLTGSPGETLRWELGYRRRPATAMEQYQDWARSALLPDTAVEPGDDADADGASNLVEFFTGTNPLNASDHSGLHGVVRSAAGGIEVGIQVRRANGVAAVRVRLERSRDLSRWEAVSAREELRDPGPNAEQVVFWDPNAIDGSAAYFLRLRLELD